MILETLVLNRMVIMLSDWLLEIIMFNDCLSGNIMLSDWLLGISNSVLC